MRPTPTDWLSAPVRRRRDRFDDGLVGGRGRPGEGNLLAGRRSCLRSCVCARIAHAYRRNVVASWGADRRLASARVAWVVRAVPRERLSHCGLGLEGGAGDITATLREVQRRLTRGSDREPESRPEICTAATGGIARSRARFCDVRLVLGVGAFVYCCGRAVGRARVAKVAPQLCLGVGKKKREAMSIGVPFVRRSGEARSFREQGERRCDFW